ncbi:NADPH:quinone reductase [Microbulbifer halophilus]|uniref:NADPH:quinone reductase n=1 Tax=Microbulbifer halophilus TaxID=453963 RepID=A0ABW5EE53_9GAMM|nr:NADPH:quinone reductase [Microbulbifer halophilus]MCW8128083.1 NADPH:quinone reductase [Microbulbifer halophilus]
MKAVYYERQGEARDVLVLGEIPVSEPGPGEVRVRVYVSGLNPTDIKARTGFSSSMAFPRIIPHQDGAGVIDAVGEQVSAERIGERVWIYEAQYGGANGTAAEYVVVPSLQAVPLPENVPFDIGATLGIPALTAHRCLFADGELSGRRVLVHGGAGVVGTATILLAKWAGAWVATTVAGEMQAEVASANGADLIIDRFEENVADVILDATDGAGVERIVDVNVKSNLDTDLRCLAQGGVVSAYAVDGAGDELSLPMLKAMMQGVVLRFVYIYHVSDEAKKTAITDINQCLAAGVYKPRIGLNLGLDHIAEAHEALESGKVLGKVLISNG